jgi:glutamate synthase domain-containing protein 2
MPKPTRSIEVEESASFDRHIIDYIQRASATGLYEIRGMGAKRRLPHFDDLVMLGASMSRYPLEGYREKCSTRTVLGTRFATQPLELDIPLTIAGMSFGALSANVKEALGTRPGFCHHCHTGRCPVGVTTQDAVLEQRLHPDVGAKRLTNYLKTLNMELTTIARACGKQDVHHLEKEDLVALTVEAAAMANIPLAGTNWVPGK